MPRGFFAGSRVAAKAPAGTIPACGACGIYKKCTTPKMAHSGRGGRGVLIVTDTPTKEEDRQGVALVGSAGDILTDAVQAAGVNIHADCWKTSALICHPPKARQPTSDEVDHCRPNLNKLIKDLQPDIIIPMGSAAVRAVIGPIWKDDPGGIARWTGWQIPSQTANAWVCPVNSPQYLALMLAKQNNSIEADMLLRSFRRQVEAALDLDGKPWDPVPDWEQDVRIELNTDKAAKWLRQLVKQGRGMTAYDYETNTLKPDGPKARIVSASVAWGKGDTPTKTIAFPWAGAVPDAFRAYVRSPIPKVASNLKFEERWTNHEYGHGARGWYWDTMIAAHVADCRPEISSLKFQSFVRLGMPSFNDHIEPFLKSKGTSQVNQILKEIDIKDLLLYNGLDSLLEYRVAIKQMRERGYPLPFED